MVGEPSAVEDHGVDAGGLGPLGDELTDALGGGDRGTAVGAQVGLIGGCSGQGEARIVVDPYEIEVDTGTGSPVPVRFREKIRALGPTVRLDLGKQARRQASAA